MCRFHTQTAGSSLTAQSIANNVVRTTLQALAAVLGGTQSLHTNSRDEALALPTVESARLALRTQQIIAEETEVAHVADPLAGSYFIEAQTAEAQQTILRVTPLKHVLTAYDQRAFVPGLWLEFGVAVRVGSRRCRSWCWTC